MRATSVAKYQPPERISSAGPSAISSPRPEQHHAGRERAANSTSWVATTTAGAALRRGRRASRRARPCGRGPSRESARPGRSAPAARRRSRPAITIASASRWRSPPERSRGSLSAAHSSPTAASARAPGLAGELVGDPLADQQVGRALRQQRAPARRLEPHRARAPRSPAAAPQQGALARAVAAHQRDAARPGSTARSMPAQRRRADRRPASSSTQSSRTSSAAAPRAAGGREHAAPPGSPLTGDPRPASRSQGAPRLLHRYRHRRQPGEREQPRRRRRQLRVRDQRPLAGSRVGRRRTRSAPASTATTRSAADRQRSSRCSASSDGHPPLLVQPPQQPDQLVAGDRVELRGRLVEQHQPRAQRPAPRRARPAAAPRRRACRSGARAGASIASARVTSSIARAREPRRARRAARAAAPAPRAPWPRRPGSPGPGRPGRPGHRARPGRARERRGPQTSSAP